MTSANINKSIPSLTVITPTYNRCDFLECAFNSLRELSFIAEWIVVDDGSTDNTEATILNLSEQNHASVRVEYIKASHGGMKAAINIGLAKATGQYFCKLDSDDKFLKEFESAYKEVFSYLKEEDETSDYNQISFGTVNQEGDPISRLISQELRHGKIKDGHVLTYARHRLYEQALKGDLLDIFETKEIQEHFRYPIVGNSPHTPTGIMHLSACLKAPSKKQLYIDVACLQKNYLFDGITRSGKNSLPSNPETYAISAAYEMGLTGHSPLSLLRSSKTLLRALFYLLTSKARVNRG